jgi:hypothetical protein
MVVFKPPFFPCPPCLIRCKTANLGRLSQYQVEIYAVVNLGHHHLVF